MVGLKLKLFTTSIAGGFYKVVVFCTTTLSLDVKKSAPKTYCFRGAFSKIIIPCTR